MARMASTLRHLSYLAPSYSRLDGLALARTLVDHVITFAWISGDPEDAAPRIPAVELQRTSTATGELRQRGDTLLDEDKRQRLSGHMCASGRATSRACRGSRRRPTTPGANASGEAAGDAPHPEFEGLYTEIYDQFATFDHPTRWGSRFSSTGGRSGGRDRGRRAGARPRDDLRPYWFAVFAFAEALVVSHLASGRPRLQSLQRNLGTIGTMRELERAGRLAVTVGEDGTVNIGVADDDGAEDIAPP